MSDRASEGVLLLLAAIGILLLWLRGYLTPYITAVSGAVATSPTKTPFKIPGATATGSAFGGGGSF
jgi:hypothetical protein